MQAAPGGLAGTLRVRHVSRPHRMARSLDQRKSLAESGNAILREHG